MKRTRALIFVALLLVSVGCDHVAKQIAHGVLANSPGVSVAADTLRFELTSNPGAFLSLGAGGGLSNWLDRLLHGGAVTDFVSLGLGPLRTGVFNLADVFIVAGVALLLLHSLQPGGSRRGTT